MTGRAPTRPADERAVRAATWRLAAMTAGAVTLTLLVVGALVLAVVVREQRDDAARALRQAVTDVDDVAETPSGVPVWVRRADGTVLRSPDAPTWLPVRAAVRAVTVEQRVDERTVRHGGETYRLRTVRHPGGLLAQAAYDTGTATEERDRLVTAVLLAEAVGLFLSALLGVLLARRAVAPLAAALDRQRRFVADASHELRTPLTLLSTRAQLLERALRGGGREDVHEQSVSLVDDTRRMAAVVDDLLLAASLTAEPHRRERVDLREVAIQSVAAATDHAEHLGVTLVGPDRSPAPGEDGRTTVLGASGPLRRVLDALLDNAVTHTPPGGCVQVDVTGGADVAVRVGDTGTGIDPEIAPRLYHRFAHATDGQDRRAGFGLGLSLVREIVEAHDGRVRAWNNDEGGATFEVSLSSAGTSTHPSEG